MNGLSNSGVLLNRKMLSQLAIEEPKTFDLLVAMSEEKTTAQASA
jgi:ribosomal protein L20